MKKLFVLLLALVFAASLSVTALAEDGFDLTCSYTVTDEGKILVKASVHDITDEIGLALLEYFIAYDEDILSLDDYRVSMPKSWEPFLENEMAEDVSQPVNGGFVWWVLNAEPGYGITGDNEIAIELEFSFISNEYTEVEFQYRSVGNDDLEYVYGPDRTVKIEPIENSKPEESDPISSIPEESDPVSSIPEESDPISSIPEESDPVSSITEVSKPEESEHDSSGSVSSQPESSELETSESEDEPMTDEPADSSDESGASESSSVESGDVESSEFESDDVDSSDVSDESIEESDVSGSGDVESGKPDDPESSVADSVDESSLVAKDTESAIITSDVSESNDDDNGIGIGLIIVIVIAVAAIGGGVAFVLIRKGKNK